jgi:hypothetical protein
LILDVGGIYVVASKKTGSHHAKGKQIVAEKKSPAKPHTVGPTSATVTIDRRESRERRGAERRIEAVPVVAERRILERRTKVARRRQIDPTTCERDYTPEEVEFMSAMDEYKRRSGRMFPTCSEVLEVIKSLGYEKRPRTEAAELSALDLAVTLGQGTAVAV